jgi:hypothetical protein
MADRPMVDLEKRRLLEIAGHHTRVTTACSQMIQQCPETMYRQTLWCQVRPLLESHQAERTMEGTRLKGHAMRAERADELTGHAMRGDNEG